MTERPILFSAPMVRALQAGTKTQTRRTVKPQDTRCDPELMPDGKTTGWRINVPHAHGPTHVVTSPYGVPDDRLWVKETWRACEEVNGVLPRDITPAHRIWYEADAPHQPGFGKLRPSIFMPRWASRITLEVTGVRVERLQDISAADAIAEGLKGITKDGRLTKYGIPDADGLPGTDDTGWPWSEWRISPIDAYQAVWESINGIGSWAANPWVWVVSFEGKTP